MAANRMLVAVTARLLRTRRVVRAPIGLYQARLGAVFGSRLLMLEHTGRRSGRRRRVVLEVVARPTAGSYVVAAGFGARADWYRNIGANPRVRVWTASRRPRPGTARHLTPKQGSAALADYAAAHPQAWRSLRPVFEATLHAPIDTDHTSLPLVRIDLDPPTAAAGEYAPASALDNTTEPDPVNRYPRKSHLATGGLPPTWQRGNR